MFFKPKRHRRLSKIRRPPKGYEFIDYKYRSDLHTDFGNELKSQYPELRKWDGGSIASAWGCYTESTRGASLYLKPPLRNRDFLAYLFAEQELRDLGLMVRSDGVPFIYYSLYSLEPFWEEYDWIMEKRKLSTVEPNASIEST